MPFVFGYFKDDGSVGDRSCESNIEITANSECKSQHHLNAVWTIVLIRSSFANSAPTETYIMKASSLVSLICCMTINGVNSLYQPAVARELPQLSHIAEALTSTTPSADAADKYEVFQVGDKYGYADTEDDKAIAVRFDNADEIFDDLAGIRIDRKLGSIDKQGTIEIAATTFDKVASFNDNIDWVIIGK